MIEQINLEHHITNVGDDSKANYKLSYFAQWIMYNPLTVEFINL